MLRIRHHFFSKIRIFNFLSSSFPICSFKNAVSKDQKNYGQRRRRRSWPETFSFPKKANIQFPVFGPFPSIFPHLRKLFGSKKWLCIIWGESALSGLCGEWMWIWLGAKCTQRFVDEFALRWGKWAISSEHRRPLMMMTLARHPPSKIGFILCPNSCPKNDQGNYFFDTLSKRKMKMGMEGN